MSRDLVDVDEFTSPVHVPEGIDTRDDAAGDVARLAQALANRTHNLNLHGARRDAAGVWTQGQQFNVLNADVAMLESIAKPSDVGGPNIWKLQLKLKQNDGTYTRLYSGSGIEGNWALTSNAKWDPSGGQQWSKDDTGKESNVLRCFSGELHFYGKAPGTGSWGPTGWDTHRGVVRIGDELHAGNISVDVSGLYKYESAPTRWVQLQPEGGFDGSSYQSRVIDPGKAGIYRVRVPHGAVIGQFNIKVEEFNGVKYTIRCYIQSGIDFSNTSTPVTALTGTEVVVTNGGSPPGIKNYIVNFPSLTVDNETKVYWVRVAVDATSPEWLPLHAAQLSFTDPGPRNH